MDAKNRPELDDASVHKISIQEVRKRLRTRNLPIILFG